MTNATIADAFDEMGDILEFQGANQFRVRAIHRQFVLPIALHKVIGSRSFTTRSEAAFNRLGLLKAFGSPVTLIAERCAIS